MQASENRLQRAQLAGNIGVWEYDILTGRRVWSDLMWQLYGHTPKLLDDPSQVSVGLGPVAVSAFSVATMFIAVPTGVKIFNWLATMWGGQLRFSSAMLFALGFIALFLIGGLDGAFLAVVPFDFHVQDTYWVVSHLHYVLVAGSVFGIFAGLFYWFPKMTGRMLNEPLGKLQFVLLFVGTNLTFFPQHLLGLDGMIRRIVDYADNPGWTAMNFLSTIGAFMIAVSVLPFLWNVFISLRKPRDAGDDPWEGNTLEWMTSSPPPEHNFDKLPEIHSERPNFDRRVASRTPSLTSCVASRARNDPVSTVLATPSCVTSSRPCVARRPPPTRRTSTPRPRGQPGAPPRCLVEPVGRWLLSARCRRRLPSNTSRRRYRGRRCGCSRW